MSCLCAGAFAPIVPLSSVGKTGGWHPGDLLRPGVTHRKRSASLARGLKGAQFSVACVGTEPGPQRLPVGESAGTGH